MKKLLHISLLLALLMQPTYMLSEPHTPTRQAQLLEEIFLTAQVASQEELDRLNNASRDLDLALSFEKDGDGNRVAHLNVRGFDFLIPQKLLEKIYASLAQTNPYHNYKAQVRTFKNTGSICADEQNFIKARLQKCHDAVENLVGAPVPAEKTPRIAVCCSGGGCRAAISTAGFLDGLSQTEVLDAVAYLTSLSGSTWAVAPWMLCHNNFERFYPELIERIVTGFTNKSPEERIEELKDTLPYVAEYFLKKLIFKEIPSIIDVYGYILALTLLDPSLVATDYFSIDLADQQLYMSTDRPFPIYTAAIPHDDAVHYAWLTFSPFEVGSCELRAAVPTWAYGREFSKGVSVNNAPPITQGFLLGLWGSAVSISFEEFYGMMIDNLEPKALFAPLKYLAQSTEIGDVRVFPAEIRNMTYNLNGFPLAHDSRTTVIDAGLHFNIPLPPLLNPERKVDIIIVLDTSGDVLGAPELSKARDWAHANNLPFPYINYHNITNKTFSVFDDGPDHPETPIVIYVPMIKNPNYHIHLDPQDHLGLGGFMNTFNFDYSEEEAKALAGLLRQAAFEVKDEIVRVIKRSIARKK